MVIPSVYDKHILHDFILRYAKFLHMRLRRIQDFLQLPVSETARAFSYLVIKCPNIILHSQKNLFSDNKEKELIKNVCISLKKTEKLNPI